MKTLVLFLDVHNMDKSQGKQVFSNGFKRRVTWYVFWTGQYGNIHSSPYT